MDKLGAWVMRHPDTLVVGAGIVLLWSAHTFNWAVQLRDEIRRHAGDLAREASEALGG